MRIAAVVRGSMADAAGLAPGDVIAAIDDVPLRSLEALREVTRRSVTLETIAITATRHGEAFETTARVVPRPVESVAGCEVSYEHVVAADGARLRTIVTRPSAPGRRPAVLFLQGIGRDSMDFGWAPFTPFCRLVHGWAQDGFVTIRLEKRGVGDSEGEEADFATEVADFAAAWRALAEDPAVDPAALFMFGHSVGGMIAPLLDSDSGPERVPAARGLIVFGSSAAKWFDCLAASTRRQLALRGASASDIEAAVQRERESGFGVRTPRYHEQLEARDLGAAWGRVRGDVLVLAGEHDWVVGQDEQEAIATRVNAQRPGAAELIRLEGTDHLLTSHDSLQDSLAAYGNGRSDGRIVGETTAWMRRKMTERSPIG